MTVAMVLDPSAMIAYAAGSDAVGELLVLIAEEHRLIGLPAVALAEAFRHSADDARDMLRILAGHDSTVVIALDRQAAEEVGVAARAAPLGVAHAVTVARDEVTYLTTCDRKAVEGLVDEDLIIEI